MSVTSTALPIWVADSFKPVLVRLIEGKTELLHGLHIVRKPDIGVEFGRNRFRVGQGELEMVTFNEKHRCVFPLAPTACDCEKLGEYYGKCENQKLAPFNHREISAVNWELAKLTKPKIEDSGAKWGDPQRVFRARKIQFRILLRGMANVHSGSEGTKSTRGN